ncbi:MAG: HAMP domain-containing histidine kinase [Candidatus Kerfeldbacteria bacterium]|nr:HAMP domain-containing histidine kinase [Candidatus Kerfeldbacteria bacterium]
MKRVLRAIQQFFLNERGQLVFAVALLLLIPGALVLNTLSSIQSARRNMDIELQRKALLAERAFQTTVRDLLRDQPRLQQAITDLRASSEEVWGVDVLVPQGEQFSVLASAVPETAGRTITDLNAVIAWHEDGAIAYQTVSSDRVTVGQDVRPGDRQQRFWVVISPIKDTAGQKVALVSMKFSSQVVDDLVAASIVRAVFILFLSIIVVVLLLALNSKLFQYTVLFRKLKEVDQMKDEFISVASHELRTPITGIRGYLEMVLDGSLGPVTEQVRKPLQVVNQSAERLGVLVEDLLNVSRIEQGRLDLVLTEVNPWPVVQEVIAELIPMAREKNLPLTYQGPPQLPTLKVNRDRLKQVLVNLVGNAVKYTAKGSVSVQTEQREQELRLRIADTGIGMSPSEMERLFTKFYRIRNDKTQEISGTGLGLWITKQIVEKMNGTIEVESIEGVGSQFIVTFPLAMPGKVKQQK